VRARLRRWLRPPRTLRPTRAGWAFFLLAFGVGFAAMNTGNNLLYLVLSFLLAFLVLSGVLSEAALRGLEVHRRLPDELSAERPASIVLEVTNAQRRVPSFAVVVEDLVGPSMEAAVPAGRVFAFRVEPGGREARSYRLRPAARGPLRFAGFRVSTRFPFGLFSKAMRIEAPAEALVFPAQDRLSVRAASAGGRGDEPGPSARGTSPEAASLRGFAPGDAYRLVHWRASLRRGALLVRDRARERQAEHTVRLRTRGVDPGPGFEAAVRRAASEVSAHVAAGFRVGLRTEAALLPAREGVAQRRRLLAFLARAMPEPGAPA
jgi:uncharacterized protein (DUF58 family)